MKTQPTKIYHWILGLRIGMLYLDFGELLVLDFIV